MYGHVVTVHERRPAGWLDARRKNADRRRLARSVWPEQSEDLSLVDPQVQVVEGHDVAGLFLRPSTRSIVLGQTVGFQDSAHRRHALIGGSTIDGCEY